MPDNQARSQEASSTVAPPATPAAAPLFTPGLDDLMTLLVQPRHLKVYYAGSRKNWELAAAQLSNLRAAFTRISQLIPRYQGTDVTEAVNSTMLPKIQALDAAIKSADSRRFGVAYGELTAACNACHAYLEHPFHVIRIPPPDAQTAFPDQEFGNSSQ